MLYHGDEHARLEGGGMLRQNANDHLPDGIRQNVLAAHLHDTRTARTCQREQGSEIEVVGEHDVPVIPRVAHQLGVGSTRVSDRGPVYRLDVVSGEDGRPRGRQVHVDENLHCARGGSTSSARHAAYASAALMSAGSRYADAARLSAAVFPAASSPTMVPPLIPNPPMHGRPPITWGSCVIRARASIR